MTERSTDQDRRSRAARIRAEHTRAEQRRGFLVVGAAAAVGAVIVGLAAIAVVDGQRASSRLEAATKRPIKGVERFTDLSRNHVSFPVDYPQTPSVGGDHAGVWTNCGVYDTELDPMQTTHSLEHGAVWIGYDPALDSAQVERLTELAETNSYVVLSPVDGVPSPVTLSAWGYRLQLDSADDPRLAVFVQKYQQGPQTPEPGAPCTGGV